MRRDQWAGVIWLGVLTTCVALRVSLGAAGAPYLATIAPYMLVSAGVPVVVLIGVLWHRPPHRAGWFLLIVAQVLYAVADSMTVYDSWLGEFLEPTPADIVYFLYYLLLCAAVLVFIRRRSPGWDLPSGVDALVVAISAGLLSWIYVLEPLTADSGLPLNAKLTQAAYPVLDLMVFILAIRLVMGTGAGGPVLHLLLGSMSLMFVVDTAYVVEGIADGSSAVFESSLDAMWMIALGMLGSAALLPGVRRFDQRSDTAVPDASPARLVMLAVAVLMAPGVQFIEWLRGEPVSVPLISAACAVMFLLMLARMSGLVATQRRAAVTDSLTGLHTRRHFTQALAVECRRSVRTGHQVGLLVIDVDHFKQINDGYGHPAGDQVLREVARRLTAGSRTGGVVARYGGEEFVVLAPHTGPDGLLVLAERLRSEVCGLPVDIGGELLAVTVSIGAAAQAAPGPDALMHAADAALYAAKATGRNRCVLAPPSPGLVARRP